MGTFVYECCPAALKSTSSRRRWSFFQWPSEKVAGAGAPDARDAGGLGIA